MKKVMILAYDFPPYVSVGGLRPYNWFRYFKEFDVEPIVVTRQWNNTHGNSLDYISPSLLNNTVVESNEIGTIIKVAFKPNLANKMMLKFGEHKYRLFRKSISAFYEVFQFYFPIGSKVGIYQAAKEYLIDNKVDAIIATGDPFILFKYAAKLSNEFKTPWIADYRDPWSHNDDLSINYLQRLWLQNNEKKIVSTATCISTVSSFVQRKVAKLLPLKNYVYSPNGYDPEVIDSVKNIEQNREGLQIGFAGSLFDWHPIESFLRVAADFAKSKENPTFKINFYGINTEDSLKMAIEQQFPILKNHVNIFPKMSNAEVMKQLVNNNVLLLFNYYSYMGTKIFDYLGIRRKIILCYENDPEANALKKKYYKVKELEGESKQLQAELITETNSGIVVKDRKHLAQVLEDLYAEFQREGSITCASKNIEQYSRKIQVEQLASFIKAL